MGMTPRAATKKLTTANIAISKNIEMPIGTPSFKISFMTDKLGALNSAKVLVARN